MEKYIRKMVQTGTVPQPIRENVSEEMVHGIEVSNLAVMIAKELGESKKICSQLASAGTLHDIGKLKLMKYLYAEDGLLVEQMKYVRQHTIQSYEMIMDAGYSREIARAVYYHHENYDGSGYPGNLCGENIPWMARILRVCDVFVALTADRSYRKAFEPRAAVEIMIDEVMDYDMKVFLAFQRVMHKKVFKEGMEQMKKLSCSEQKEALQLFEQELQRMVLY